MSEVKIVSVHEDLVVKLIEGFQGIIDYYGAETLSGGLPVLDVFNAAANVAIHGAIKAGMPADAIERAFRGLVRQLSQEYEANKHAQAPRITGGH